MIEAIVTDLAPELIARNGVGLNSAANSALHIIVIGRLRLDPKTQDYVARRLAQGHSNLTQSAVSNDTSRATS